MSRAPRVLLERLGAHHYVSMFDSGNEMLDGWLRRHALAAQQMDSARTFVVTKGPCRRLFQPHDERRVSSRCSCKARSRHARLSDPNGVVGPPGSRPSEQGRDVGAMLVAEASRKAVAAGEVATARLIVVDAVDENAAAFYERYGLVSAPEHPLRLYRRMKDVRASLDSSEARSADQGRE